MDTKIFIIDFHKKHLLPLSISLTDIELEEQNNKYCGAKLKLNNHTIRFRKAKLTPTKAGFFVVAWEKDSSNNNQAYSYIDSPDYLIVYCEVENRYGIFVFPKSALLENNIVRTDKQKGKMGFRVYPTWEDLSSKQALQSQKWQREYFVDLNEEDSEQQLKQLLEL